MKIADALLNNPERVEKVASPESQVVSSKS